MTATDVVWADPPAPVEREPRGAVALFVEALKERPGCWAISPKPQKYETEKYRRTDRYPGTEWRNVRRTDGMFDVYGRWVGLNGEHSEEARCTSPSPADPTSSPGASHAG